MTRYSPRYNSALILATRTHHGQRWMQTDIPYIVHLFHVSVLLIQYGFDEDLAIAGLLHEVAQDHDVALQEIAATCGVEVARLVESVSEQKLGPDGQKLSWEDRRQGLLARLRDSGPHSAALAAVNMLYNIAVITQDGSETDPQDWARFSRQATIYLAYGRALLSIVQQQLGQQPLAIDLAAALADLERVSARKRI